MDRLLIPLDLSGEYEDLIGALEAFRWGPHATLLHVIEEIRGVRDVELEEFYRSLESRAVGMLRDVASRLAELGLTCDIEVRRGRRGETIVRVAAERDSGVVLLVSHPLQRGTSGVRVGSTSHQVALAAPCSVFLLRKRGSEAESPHAPTA